MKMKMSNECYECCCTCRHRILEHNNSYDICEVDKHRIGYVQCFEDCCDYSDLWTWDGEKYVYKPYYN